jgi:hypothetical protein
LTDSLCAAVCSRALLRAAPYVLLLQAPQANVEAQRSLTWIEAMKAGKAPLPPKVDDVYTDPGPGPDMHQLAASVRDKRVQVSALQQRWNELVRVSEWVGVQGGWGEWQACVLTHPCIPAPPACLQSNAQQAQMRELRSQLNAARAEFTVAQADLVAARTEESRKRQLQLQEAQEDKRLGGSGEVGGNEAWGGCQPTSEAMQAALRVRCLAHPCCTGWSGVAHTRFVSNACLPPVPPPSPLPSQQSWRWVPSSCAARVAPRSATLTARRAACST